MWCSISLVGHLKILPSMTMCVWVSWSSEMMLWRLEPWHVQAQGELWEDVAYLCKTCESLCKWVFTSHADHSLVRRTERLYLYQTVLDQHVWGLTLTAAEWGQVCSIRLHWWMTLSRTSVCSTNAACKYCTSRAKNEHLASCHLAECSTCMGPTHLLAYAVAVGKKQL